MAAFRRIVDKYVTDLKDMDKQTVNKEAIQLGLVAAFNTMDSPLRPVYSNCRNIRQKPSLFHLGHGKTSILYVF